jgi:uncharacterized membrane protein YuzA (DUF378 family)
MRILHTICMVMAIGSALNAGLWGLLQVDVLAAIFGGPAGPVTRVVYSILGLAGLGLIWTSVMLHDDRLRPVPTRAMPR